ncbi:hypothetical protein H0W32_02340, partial [Patescibacteria group bacterium]|nr:hypothetical protein [Patescibacteria group bacterium]
MKNYDRIKVAIDNSSFDSEDQLALIETFAVISDEHLIEIADLFEAKPEWIGFYNENRKKKMNAYQSGDEGEWNQILGEEKRMLNKLVFDSD